MQLRIGLLVLAIGACADTHDVTLDDAGMSDARTDTTGACSAPPPAGCAIAGREPGCCEAVPPECVDGEWYCPRPEDMGWACETFRCGEPPECRGFPSNCRAMEAGCCGDETTLAECQFGRFVCPAGYVEEMACPPECPTGECEGRTEVACLANPGCVARYDDRCCSSCEPGPCADCVDPVFYECAERSSCGDPGVCSAPAPSACESEPPPCEDAVRVSDSSCNIPGCIPTVRCSDGPCEDTCRALRGDSCESFCFRDPPECPAGTVPEAEEGCFSDWCIAAEYCS